MFARQRTHEAKAADEEAADEEAGAVRLVVVQAVHSLKNRAKQGRTWVQGMRKMLLGIPDRVARLKQELAMARSLCG